MAAAAVAVFVYVCGFALSFALPEPQGDRLPTRVPAKL